jgi:hypothetical protein
MEVAVTCKSDYCSFDSTPHSIYQHLTGRHLAKSIMVSTYELSASGKILADIFTRANDHFERDEFEESKRLSTTTP